MELKDVKFIKCRIGNRYWEDGEVNGEEDITWEEQKQGVAPRMPLTFQTGRKTNIAPNGEYEWVITIDPLTRKILDWPEGTTAYVHYKSCDDNTITLIGENNTILGEYECYVPDFLCPHGGGCGDYVIMDIDETGTIAHFGFGKNDLEDLIEHAF